MKKIVVVILVTFTVFYACEEVKNVLDDGITDEEVIEGLKTALELGTDTATQVLGLPNGYLGNPAVKIPLPPDVELVRSTINNNSTLKSVADLIGLSSKFDDVIKGINGAAENAASEAGPIFKDAITDMSFTDAWDILNGKVPDLKSAASEDFDSTAATEYFKNATSTDLINLFGPKIDNAFDQPLTSIGSLSTTDAWESLTSQYNSFMSNSTVQTAITIASFTNNPINLPSNLNTDLGAFCTEKALNGLFYRVGIEEKKIRKNPFDWAVDIIQKVFGSIFEE